MLVFPKSWNWNGTERRGSAMRDKASCLFISGSGDLPQLEGVGSWQTWQKPPTKSNSGMKKAIPAVWQVVHTEGRMSGAVWLRVPHSSGTFLLWFTPGCSITPEVPGSLISPPLAYTSNSVLLQPCCKLLTLRWFFFSKHVLLPGFAFCIWFVY